MTARNKATVETQMARCQNRKIQPRSTIAIHTQRIFGKVLRSSPGRFATDWS